MPDPDNALIKLRESFERFGPLPDPVWEQLRRPWRLREARRDQILTHIGHIERSFSLVLEGTQRVYFVTPAGDEVTVAFTFPYHYSGIPDSFFLQQPSLYALEALTEGAILSIDYDAMKRLMDDHREIERWAWKLFAFALVGRGQREREHLTLTAEERYHRLFRDAPQLFQRVAQKHIASYLGMTPETLSRIRSGRS